MATGEKKNKSNSMSNEFNFLLYKAENEDISVNALVKDETIWLTQKAMAELFDVDVPAISKHLFNIYADGELTQDATISKMETARRHSSGQTSPEFL